MRDKAPGGCSCSLLPAQQRGGELSFLEEERVNSYILSQSERSWGLRRDAQLPDTLVCTCERQRGVDRSVGRPSDCKGREAA
jgi:hypothetical protein